MRSVRMTVARVDCPNCGGRAEVTEIARPGCRALHFYDCKECKYPEPCEDLHGMMCPRCGSAAPSQYSDGRDMTCPACNVRLVSSYDQTARRDPIIQDWVTRLGMRHQGVLMASVRGCDTAPKDDPSKLFARCLRDAVLRPHCGDSGRAVSFIEAVDGPTLESRFTAFIKNCDHYPLHYVMHVIHAMEIVGYKHPDREIGDRWLNFYIRAVDRLHLVREGEQTMDLRLNADGETFGKMQKA